MDTKEIDWDEYFMSIALVAALKSNDPNTHVGACIIDRNNKLVSIGYNKLPDWFYDRECDLEELNSKDRSKYFYVNHAEMEAVLNLGNSIGYGGTMYITHFPCNDCAKIIAKNGIGQIVYYREEHNYQMDCSIAARNIFKYANIITRQYKIKGREIELKL
jgi:dCMP deaminase